MKTFARHVAGFALLTLVATGCGFGATAPHHSTGSGKRAHPVPTLGMKARWSKPPALSINPNGHYRATVVTSLGTFVIALFAKQDPVSVNNFVFLARHDFYNGDRIFRIIKPFVFQTGDPNQNGTGGPGYTFRGRIPPAVPYGPGIVAYANRGVGTNGSQFFVCTGPESTYLNTKGHAIYPEIGRVVSGMNVVEKIAAVPVTVNPETGEDSLPTHPVIVQSITITGP
jgi:cyclophilin family peptidyl-prolyl cis-trans isomerase